MALRLRNAVKRFSLKILYARKEAIAALGDSVLPNESAAFAEKCSRDVWNASLTVFFGFSKKSVDDYKLICGGVSARLDLRAT